MASVTAALMVLVFVLIINSSISDFKQGAPAFIISDIFSSCSLRAIKDSNCYDIYLSVEDMKDEKGAFKK